MTSTPHGLGPAGLQFLTERHLASYTSLRPDGRPHVTPVGITWDARAGIARVITNTGSRKARHAASGGPVVLCQFDGRRWLSLDGTARLSDDPAEVADAVARYTQRYRQPRPNSTRVVIHIAVHAVYGSPGFFTQRTPAAGG